MTGQDIMAVIVPAGTAVLAAAHLIQEIIRLFENGGRPVTFAKNATFTLP
jgi:hypothetical protein